MSTRTLTVLFGSQTGTATMFAQQLEAAALRRGFAVDCLPLDVALDQNTLQRKNSTGPLVLISSVFGRGQPPDNATRMCQWLNEDAGGAAGRALADRPFAVFGLGKSDAYQECYQAVGKMLDRRLDELGARRLVQRGEGDDADDIEEDWACWEEALWPVLERELDAPTRPSPESLQPQQQQPNPTLSGANRSKLAPASPAATTPTPAAPVSPTTRFIVDSVHGMRQRDASGAQRFLSIVPDESDATLTSFNAAAFSVDRPFRSPVRVNRELTGARSLVSVRHLELDLSGSNMTYEAGDYLGVLPEQPDAVVEETAGRLGVDVDAWLRITPRNSVASVPSPLPSVASVRMLLRRLDLQGALGRRRVQGLAQLASDDTDRSELDRLGSRPTPPSSVADSANGWAGRRVEGDGGVDPRVRSFIDVLRSFPSLRLTTHDGDGDNGDGAAAGVARLLDVVPPIVPRFYSIASSPRLFPDEVHLAVRVVQSRLSDGRVHHGVASNYLANMRPGSDTVRCFVKQSLLRLPSGADADSPVVMVAGGTGVAPWRSFWQERRHKRLTDECDWLFDGIDRRDIDWLYSDELAAVDPRRLRVVVSEALRDPSQPPVFVQHRMVAFGSDLWRVIAERRGSVYVCGHAALGRGVRQALASIAQEYGGMDDGDVWVRQLEQEHRLHWDIY